MVESNTLKTPSDLTSEELEFPETVFVRDIENRVFQAIVLQCLAKIEGITLIEGGLIDNFLGRASLEGVKGISAEQDPKDHGITVKVEVNICYGIPIPQKADEIQNRLAEELSELTGLHVRRIHVVFKSVVLQDPREAVVATRVEPRLITEQVQPEPCELPS